MRERVIQYKVSQNINKKTIVRTRRFSILIQQAAKQFNQALNVPVARFTSAHLAPQTRSTANQTQASHCARRADYVNKSTCNADCLIWMRIGMSMTLRIFAQLTSSMSCLAAKCDLMPASTYYFLLTARCCCVTVRARSPDWLLLNFVNFFAALPIILTLFSRAHYL